MFLDFFWYGCHTGFDLFGSDVTYTFKTAITDMVLGFQQWWVNFISGGAENLKSTAMSFNKNSFTDFTNLEIVDTVILIATTFGVVFIFIKMVFAIFKYYSVQLDDGVSPLTIEYLKKVGVALLFCALAPYLIITGFRASTNIAEFAIQELEKQKPLKDVDVFKDINENHLSLKTYCYEGIKEDKEEGHSNEVLDNLVEGTHDYKTSNKTTFKDTKLKIKGDFITLFPSEDENNTGKTMTRLYNTYCKEQSIYNGYKKDKDGNYEKDEKGKKIKIVVKNEKGKAEKFQPLRVAQTIKNNPDLSSQLPNSITGFIGILIACVFCAVTAFNISVRIAELLVLLMMTPFYAMNFVDVGRSNAIQVWMQEFTSLIMSHAVSLILFEIFMATCANGQMLTLSLGLLWIQLKGPSAVRAWSHNTGVSAVGNRAASGLKSAFSRRGKK